MTKRILILFIILFNLNGNAQNASDKNNEQQISYISIGICDSIKSLKAINSHLVNLQQTEIYSKFLNDYILIKQENLKHADFKNEFNVLNYKLINELNKTCKDFKIKNSTILPFTNLIDIDSIFSTEETEKINVLARQIRTKNKMEIVILTIDDLYPEKDIDEFSINKLTDWKVGGVYQKSGAIIVLNKKLKKVYIATTEIAKNYLTNENCDKLITNIMVPNFKTNNYFEGIYKSLIEISNILK
ncbi:TPM domain-containing protein [Flavobacterium denitrificans]|uniref:TPM domain-containing protein n=1 Tax=Flavobacterium denitrificans TaxID=281361 RepID=UPI0003F78922|nr:TPM domain-containing protein [Flavobacterium denitrificans]